LLTASASPRLTIRNEHVATEATDRDQQTVPIFELFGGFDTELSGSTANHS
jgi:hypothetical protein